MNLMDLGLLLCIAGPSMCSRNVIAQVRSRKNGRQTYAPLTWLIRKVRLMTNYLQNILGAIV
jgi:hypothetical protein